MSQNTVDATIQDGEKILEMIESSPAKGNIQLLYTRRPNAYLSYKKESNNVRVLKVIDEEKIIGTMSKITREQYIDENISHVSYLCGLKKNEKYEGKVNWGKVWLRNLVDDETDCYICSVLSDNIYAQNMAKKKRNRTLNMELLGDYTTYIMAPYFKFKIKENNYVFRQASNNDEKTIINFLNNEGKKKELFPVFYNINQFTDLKVTDFYILENNCEILAIGALWKQLGYRQYIVKRYKGIMKYAKIFNPLLKVLGYIKLPMENEVINFPMLSFFISKNDNEEYYKVFLNNIIPIIKKQYNMFIIGITKCNFANKIYKKLRNIHFDSKIYAIDFIYKKGRKKDINKDKLWLECGLL